MPRAINKIRRRSTVGIGDVLDPLLEETLVFGAPIVLGPSFSTLRFQADWQREWERWRATIMPKAMKHRPGFRPFAMYATGEIETRQLLKAAPRVGFTYVDVIQRGGATARHWLDLPAGYLEPEATYLHRLGIVDHHELERFWAWCQEPNPECDRCLVDHYPLEAALHN
jgi:hypothetical protein